MRKVTVDITGMSVKQLHEELSTQIAEGRGDFVIWRPASVHPAAARHLLIDSDDQNILLE